MRGKIQTIVSANWLSVALKSGTRIHVTESGRAPKMNDSFVLESYLKAHIPNASYTNLVELADQTSPLPLTVPSSEQFAQYASERGITNEDHVVIYDQTPNVSFQYSVSRTWFLFKLFGHEKVSILDGGIHAWIKDGQAVTDEKSSFKKSVYNPKLNAEMLKNYEDIMRNSKCNNSEFQLLDARGEANFMRGNVPHAKNVPFSEFYNEDGTFKDCEQLELVFEQKGVNLDSPTVAMCNAGMSACLLSLAAHELGYQMPIYDGSWSEILFKQQTEPS